MIPENNKIAVFTKFGIFAGLPMYTDGKVTGLKDAVSMKDLPLPGPQGINLVTVGTMVGDFSELPEDRMIAVLSERNSYYLEWVNVTSNLVTAQLVPQQPQGQPPMNLFDFTKKKGEISQ